MFKKLAMTIVTVIDTLLRGFNALIRILHIREPIALLIRGIARLSLMMFHFLFFRMQFFGKENVPKNGGVILAANHQSYLDPPMVGVCLFRRIKFISKKENHEIPILGPLIELGDSFPIDRSGDEDALSFFTEQLKKGETIAVFPEGTIPAEEDKLRSDVERNTGLLKGKTGAVRLALESRVPIVPVGISGSGKALRPEAIPRIESFPCPKPTKVYMRFGEPMDLSPYYDQPVTRELLRKLTDELMGKISAAVDHQMNFIPHKIPLTDEDYEKIKSYETKTRPGYTPRSA